MSPPTHLSYLTALQDAQLPILALMLLGGCAAKFARAVRMHSVDAGLGPTALFPLHLRPFAAATLCATELGLGIGLIATAGEFGEGSAAMYIRVGTCLLFVVATFALVELRTVRPDIGCGCFGEFSSTPITTRTLIRSVLLAAAALATVEADAITPTQLRTSGSKLILIFVIELAVIALLSPEVRDILVRIGYSEPCELRAPSAEQTLATLKRSAQWRRHFTLIADDEPVDVWRELCWRYLAFPSRYNG